jgi:hypothetical protein
MMTFSSTPLVIILFLPSQVNHQQVSIFLTAGNIKFILLHAGRSDDSIKNFFHEVYELYVKVGRGRQMAGSYLSSFGGLAATF